MLLALLLALVAVGVAAADGSKASEQPDAVSAQGAAASQEHPHHRAERWVVFRPMFVTKNRGKQLRRSQAVKKYWRKQRPRRALHFPVSRSICTKLA